MILTVYPSDTGASFKLYEDEGNNEDYRKNIYSFTQFSYQKGNDGMTFRIEPDGKAFPNQLKSRSYEIRIIASQKPAQITMNGKNLVWSYDEKTKVTSIKTSKDKIGLELIEIR